MRVIFFLIYSTRNLSPRGKAEVAHTEIPPVASWPSPSPEHDLSCMHGYHSF